jgi:hypothetical protein
LRDKRYQGLSGKVKWLFGVAAGMVLAVAVPSTPRY